MHGPSIVSANSSERAEQAFWSLSLIVVWLRIVLAGRSLKKASGPNLRDYSVEA